MTIGILVGALIGFGAGLLWERRSTKAWERAWWEDFKHYRNVEYQPARGEAALPGSATRPPRGGAP